jgi:hypothetical protein
VSTTDEQTSSTPDSDQQTGWSTARRGCLGVASFGTLAVFVPLTMAFVWEMLTVGAMEGTIPAGIFSLIMSLGAGWALWRTIKAGSDDDAAAAPSKEEMQRRVLAVARKCQGHLTLAELTLETSLGLEEARSLLEDFQLQGVANLEMTDAGQEVFVFPAFVDGGRDKFTARSLLDDSEDVELLIEELAEESVDA